ncbi:hypothetical protein FMEXI_1646 [Fusarium mexicanum]|uniref:Uncharacterized protein n=1 Tax=Fusarium mexicanum TaxID=751941 RepID=A0A8H5N6A0_9HYPO|nr:hypothetical protein FMEXI_1646 [Fusarium mexicanum]
MAIFTGFTSDRPNWNRIPQKHRVQESPAPAEKVTASFQQLVRYAQRSSLRQGFDRPVTLRRGLATDEVEANAKIKDAEAIKIHAATQIDMTCTALHLLCLV